MSAGSSAFSDGWRLVPGVASVCACGVRPPSAPRRRWRPLRAPSLRLALPLGPPPPAAVVVAAVAWAPLISLLEQKKSQTIRNSLRYKFFSLKCRATFKFLTHQ